MLARYRNVSKSAKEFSKKLGKEGCEERARKAGQALLAKYGVDYYRAIIQKRWAK